MNKNTLDYDNFLCLVLPIILFIIFAFVFLLPSSFYNCKHNMDDHITYFRPEEFTDDAGILPPTVYTNSIIIGKNICYSCPVGSAFNSTSDGCTGNVKTPLSCLYPNAKLVGDKTDAMCYGCPPGQVYDSSELACVSTAPTPLSSTALDAPTNVQYKCLDDNDTLVGSSCYTCDGNSDVFNPQTMKCERITNAYRPTNTYKLQNSTSSCNSGYFKDFMTCNKCNGNDTYKSGWGCMTKSSSAPTGIVPAVVNDRPFKYIDTD